ncbi:MAG TPA: FtsX-like permease family protein, partial [Puia sp.]|nr:FtsX-like permease family protein [Puia sp.]
YDLLIPYSNATLVFNPRMLHSWGNVFNETYVLLHSSAQKARLEAGFPSLLPPHPDEEYNLYLQPLTSIHLDNTLPAGIQPVSNPKYSYILATIGLLILLVACVNFITLSVGRSTSRAIEVGVRKVLGAERRQLMRQFWGEALLLTLFSTMIGLLLTVVLLHPFNQLTDRHLPMHFDPLFVLFCIGLLAIIALAAGIYPAIILSGFNPAEVLKGRLRLKDKAGLFRKGLVVGQFLVSIVMIICTAIIAEQMHYLHYKDLGYNKDQVIIVPTNKGRAEGFRLARLYEAELSKDPRVLSASASTFSFAETPWANLGYTDEQKSYHSFMYNEIDRSFLKTMHIPIASGRGFEIENPGDSNSSILVNEALIKEYGLKDPIGRKFGIYSQRIVGVVKDFNYESLHERIKPLVLSLKFDTIARQSSDLSYAVAPQPRISIRMKAGDMQENIALLKKAWKAVAPQQDFEYRFLDQRLASAYAQEEKSSTVVRIASGLSIFIACMGLFGLVTLTITRRTKELGIRKVLGANPAQLVRLLSRDFLLLVTIAAAIAFPIAWWLMRSWLSDFAYRTDISWWIFPTAALAAIFIVLVTIGIQTIRAALSNPIDALHTE